MEVEEAEELDQQVPAFNMEQAKAEFAVAQSDKMAKQQAILESVQDEAYVKASWAVRRALRRARHGNRGGGGRSGAARGAGATAVAHAVEADGDRRHLRRRVAS